MLLIESVIIVAELLLATEPNLFQLGGYFPMSVVTLLLVALVFAAWKAPRKVKEIGLLTLALGFLWTVFGLIKHAEVMQEDIDFISINIAWAARKCWLIPIAYSIIVYIVSLVIHIIRNNSDRSVRCWLKEIGILSLALGLLWIPVGLIRNCDYMTQSGDITPSAIWWGIKNSLIPFAISLIVFIISEIIRIVIKPRNLTSD